MNHDIDDRERDAILAGLRMVQQAIEGNAPAMDEDVFTNGGDHEGLDPDEIDELCERLNH
jgi:hypothetical protein